MILKVGNIAGDLISRPCPREKEGSGMLELSITQNFSDNVNTMKAHNSGIEQALCILTTSRTYMYFNYRPHCLCQLLVPRLLPE